MGENLNQQDVLNIQDSWRHVVQAGLKQYGVNMMIRIFTQHKEIKHLWKFAVDLETQEQISQDQNTKTHGEKLFTTIGKCVDKLGDLEALIPTIIQLGYRHTRKGIKNEYFPYVGEALIGTLQDGLKEKFTQNVKESWIKMYAIVVAQMQIGMQQAEQDEQLKKDQEEKQ